MQPLQVVSKFTKKKKKTDKDLQNKNKLLRKFLFPSGSDTLVNLQINVLYQHSVF